MMMSSLNASPPSSLAAGRALYVSITAILILCCAAFVFSALRPSPAERACLKGESLLDDGRNERAAAEFERAIVLDPELMAAWRGLLKARPTTRVCRRLAQSFPELFDADQPVADPGLLVRGTGWDTARWPEIHAAYEKLLLTAPNEAADPEAAVLRLDYAGRKEIAAAWDEVRKIKADLHTMPKRPLPAGTLLPFAVYDLDEARKVIVDSVNHFDRAKDWVGMLTRINAAIETYKGGRAKLDQVLEIEPLFLPTNLTLAYVETGTGDLAAAVERCRRLLDAATTGGIGPGETRLRYCRAHALELAGRYDEAAGDIRRILENKPKDRPATLRLAGLYLKLGKVAEAEAIADEIMVEHEYDPRANHIKGVACLRRGKYEEAVTHLRTVVSRSRSYDTEAHYNLAMAQRGAGSYNVAAREFGDIASRTANPAWPLAAAAACLLAAQDGDGAAKAADALLRSPSLLKRDPELRDYAVRFKVAAVAMTGGRTLDVPSAQDLVSNSADKTRINYLIAGTWAARAYTAAAADVPVSDEQLDFFRQAAQDEPSAKYALAFLLAAAGRADEARAVLEDLVRAAPDNLLATLHLARMYMLDGKTELAARVLDNSKPAAGSPEAARVLRLIDALQGVTVTDPPSGAGGPEQNEIFGPHLAFFAITAYDDPAAYARLIVLLDPVDEFAEDVLRMVYLSIRAEGVDGVTSAARADGHVRQLIQRGLAGYLARQNGLYRLVTGNFWSDVPSDLRG